jgi:hypothetical protein
MDDLPRYHRLSLATLEGGKTVRLYHVKVGRIAYAIGVRRKIENDGLASVRVKWGVPDDPAARRLRVDGRELFSGSRYHAQALACVLREAGINARIENVGSKNRR